MPLIIRESAGANQWPDPGGAGLFSFASWNHLPRTTRVHIHRISVLVDDNAGAAGVSRISAWFQEPGLVVPTRRIILIDAIAGTTVDPIRYNGEASVLLCDVWVPREYDGTHYDLYIESEGKTQNSSSIVDWQLVPYPDTTQRDGLPP